MGKIFAIKKYAIHDGPNIRTTVFLKGCPLQCPWCHNPEGMSARLDKIWVADKCIGCGECLEKCTGSALSRLESGIITRDEDLCRDCGKCLQICPALAHESIGWEASVAEVMVEIRKDIAFYDQSGGGVTFSGGDPLLQPRFLSELLHECGHLGIHRAVDTTAYAETPLILDIADHVELFLIDLKHMDSDMHRKFTGVANKLILENTRLLAERGAVITFRLPLIGGVNDDMENIRLTGEFVTSLPGEQGIDLLPYHSIASAKYRKLGMHNSDKQFHAVKKDTVAQSAAMLRKMGLTVQVGG